MKEAIHFASEIIIVAGGLILLFVTVSVII